jgi:uncharacterized protein YycO
VSETPERDEQDEFNRRLEELKRTTRALIAQANKVSNDAKRAAARLCKTKSGHPLPSADQHGSGGQS